MDYLYTYYFSVINNCVIRNIKINIRYELFNHFKDERIPLESYSMSFDDVTYETLLFLIIIFSSKSTIKYWKIIQ
jgi:hypothetical protein